MQVNIRPLEVQDALVSYKWRNNPLVWQYTGHKPDKVITPDIELQWVRTVLTKDDEKRFAIMVDGRYVGNTYLTNITDTSAIFHIFIGETDCWGRGVGSVVMEQILKYAKEKLNLLKISLSYNTNNVAARKLYQHFNFVPVEVLGDRVFMEKYL